VRNTLTGYVDYDVPQIYSVEILNYVINNVVEENLQLLEEVAVDSESLSVYSFMDRRL